MPLSTVTMPARAAAILGRGRVASAVTALVMGGLVIGAPMVSAQDGTGGAPPLTETGCVLVPASPLSSILPEPAAGATPVGAALASPVSPERATPVAAEEPDVDTELLLEDLTASATSIASCLSEGRYFDLADRTSPLFRGQLLGIAEPVPADLFGSLAATFPDTDYSILEIDEPRVVDRSGVATAEIIWQVGHQVRVDRWTFVLGEVQGVPMWVVDSATSGELEPSIDAEVVTVSIADDAYDLNTQTVESGSVRFDITNTDDEAHELLVLRLDGDSDTSELLTTPGPSLPEGVTYIGQATVPANASGRLLLTDLEPGEYAIVCLLPDANGVPHLADGMEASFEVE